VSNAGEWTATLKAFHEKQLDRPRRVYRLGKTKVLFSRGHAACTVGAAVVASWLDFPTWTFWIAIAIGYFGGKYLFPVPRSSVASRYGFRPVARKSPGELDYMTPEEIRAYQYNVQFIQKGVTPLELGTEEALGRQSEGARAVSRAAGTDAGMLAHLSLADVHEYGRTADRHDLLKRRWLTYEVDPQLQFDFPAMSDVSLPATAAMIRAMHNADYERAIGNGAAYRLAVDRFSQTLAEAERAAGVP
jgi:hypothetical protein